METVEPKESIYKRGRLVTIFFVAALFAIGAFRALTGATGFVTTEMDDVHLGVCGTYGQTTFLELASITDIQLVDSLDYGVRVEGDETGDTVSGLYQSDTLGRYTLHAYTGVPAYIIVTHPGGTLVFNCVSESQTTQFYTRLATQLSME